MKLTFYCHVSIKDIKIGMKTIIIFLNNITKLLTYNSMVFKIKESVFVDCLILQVLGDGISCINVGKKKTSQEKEGNMFVRTDTQWHHICCMHERLCKSLYLLLSFCFHQFLLNIKVASHPRESVGKHVGFPLP